MHIAKSFFLLFASRFHKQYRKVRFFKVTFKIAGVYEIIVIRISVIISCTSALRDSRREKIAEFCILAIEKMTAILHDLPFSRCLRRQSDDFNQLIQKITIKKIFQFYIRPYTKFV